MTDASLLYRGASTVKPKKRKLLKEMEYSVSFLKL